MEIKDIASSEEEEYYTNKEMRHLQANKENDMTHDKPVILESPDTFTNKDWGLINLIDEQYGTQWEGHDPNIEEPHEMTMIPQKSPIKNDENNAKQVAQILTNVRTCTRTSRHSQILNKIF